MIGPAPVMSIGLTTAGYMAGRQLMIAIEDQEDRHVLSDGLYWLFKAKVVEVICL